MSQARPGIAGHLRRYGPLAVIAAVVIAVFASGFYRHLSLHELRERHEMLTALVRARPIACLAAYVGLYILVVAFSLPAALVMTLTGGLLFGPWAGGLAAAVACTIGATAIFIACRTAAGDFLKRRAGPAAARIAEGVRRDAFSYIVTLRLVPVTPFWLCNLALGLVDIPLGTYVVASFIGILPTSVIYAGLGSSLNQLFAQGVHADLYLALRPQVLGPLIGLALLSLAPIAVRRWRERRLR